MLGNGVSLLETIVVLLVVMLVATMAPILAPPSGAGKLARDVQALLLAARLDAIVGARPVAVLWRETENVFEVRSGDALGTAQEACLGPTSHRLKVGRYGRTEVVRGLRNHVVWLPTGLGRSCTGGAVFNGTIELRGSRTRHRIIVSAGGRVRVEAGP